MEVHALEQHAVHEGIADAIDQRPTQLRLISAPIDVIPNDSAATIAIAAVPTARFAVLEIADDSYWA
ncbi:hypothetical protein MAUB_42620 [Mycolicibacterium aubagnense]|uniref:Uncharacterized protein n=1 Tax=Mycolicibacterium aubagnense TaxID=319707 RepID=A0ABM7IHW8_9MYCO|nr:hypothetical protein C1S80_04330 [Mycolicibacterium aubagnense]BBX86389.1 hypothetical protein MAUB_42620 [Mycolicibacterium aubagnense]